jgi:hypothetical protein
MNSLRYIQVFICFVCTSCVTYLDHVSNEIFKDSRLQEDNVRLTAKIRDKEKGYWTVYGTNDNFLQIHQQDSIPAKKGTQHMYAGKYVQVGDRIKVRYLRDHTPPKTEYILLRGDILFVRTYDRQLLLLPVRYVE